MTSEESCRFVVGTVHEAQNGKWVSETPPIALTKIRISTDLQATNRDTTDAFWRGSDFVLLLDPRLHLGQHAVARLGEIAQRDPDRLAVVSAVGATQEGTPGPRKYVGSHWWSDRDLCWRREAGLLAFRPGTGPWIEDTSSPDLRAALLPRSAWETVGEFDSGLGEYAMLDWGLRARQAGVRCLAAFDAEVTGGEPMTAAAQPLSLQQIVGMLRLARKHGGRLDWISLALRRMHRAWALESAKVGFWSDYGQPLSSARRTLWYVANQARVMQRSAVQDEFRAAIQLLRTPRAGAARNA